MILESHTEKPAFPARLESVSWFHAFIIITCIAIGTAPSKIGYCFRNGVILTPLISASVALITFYNMFLFVKVGCRFQVYTFEQMWTCTFGSQLVLIPAFISIISSISINMYYTQISVQCLTDSLTILAPNLSTIFTDYWFLSFIVSLILVLPFIFNKSLRNLALSLTIKLGILIVFIICMVIEFVLRYLKDGFNPNHQLNFFKFDKNLISAFSSLVTQYLVSPIAWPSIQHVKNATQSQLVSIFLWQGIFCFTIYMTMGFFTYFTFFDEHQGGIVFQYYSNKLLHTFFTL